MANGSGATEVPTWPPPRATAPRILSLAFGVGAAIAGFLGFCLWAAILALLSVIFNLWDLFQGPKRTVTTAHHGPNPGGPVTTYPPGDRGGPTSA